MDCVFCKIIKGEIPSYKLYEDNLVMCFLDINPDSDGHMLIIPKKHYKDLDDITPEVLTHIMNISKKMKKLLEEKLNIDGLTLIQNNGEVEEVKHFHLHLKPFYNNNLKRDVQDVYELLTK